MVYSIHVFVTIVTCTVHVHVPVLASYFLLLVYYIYCVVHIIC